MSQNTKRPSGDRSHSNREEKSQTKSNRTNEGRQYSQGSSRHASKSGHKSAKDHIPRSTSSSQNQPTGTEVFSQYTNQELDTNERVSDVTNKFENYTLSPTPSTVYKLHRSSEFRLYRVLRMVWSEPRGVGASNPTEITYDGSFEKTRRFVIISNFDGHSLCLAISTYTNQGVMKHGVKAKDHAMIFSTENAPPLIKGELERGLKTPAIKINLDNSRDKLDAASRINFAKVYTIEHNSNVKFIGHVQENFEKVMDTNCYAVHDKRVTSTYGNVRGGEETTFSSFAGSNMASPYATSTTPTSWTDTQTSQPSSTYYPPSMAGAGSSFAYAQVTPVNQGSRNSYQPFSAPYDANRYQQLTTTNDAPAFGMGSSSGGQNSGPSYGDEYHTGSAPVSYSAPYSTYGQGVNDPSTNSGNAYYDNSYSTNNDLAGAGETFSDQHYPASSSNQNYHPDYYQGDYYREYDNRDR